MKKIVALIVALVLAFSLSVACAGDFSGWWADDMTGWYFSMDGSVQLWNLETVELMGEYFATVENTEDSWVLYPFTGATRYTQRFAEDEGWMSLIDENQVETSWLNSTPADVVNQGLAVREDMPLVGVWTQMTDDLTAPCFQFYDDGFFDYEDLLGVEEVEQLFGKYQLENGLLSLYTEDAGLTWQIASGENGCLAFTSGEEKKALSAFDTEGYFPTAGDLIGTWGNEESTITFHEDGTLDMAGISGYGVWSLNGARLIISSDDPLWSFASYVTFMDGDTGTIVISQADGSLSSEYTKK